MIIFTVTINIITTNLLIRVAVTNSKELSVPLL